MTPSPETMAMIQKHLRTWYETHRRQLPWRETRDPYAIWVSEVMLQQTQVKTVIPYWFKFMHTFPSITELAGAHLETVLKVWEGLGYYARARNLHRAACQIMETLNGKIPDTYAAFRQLPGVGNYIAAAVQSIAFGHGHAVVDGNVKRVLARIFCLDSPVNLPASHKTIQSLADALLDRQDPAQFNQAVMELGALVCTPTSPVCGSCPLTGDCDSLRTDSVNKFPVRIPPKKIPTFQVAVGIVRKNNRLLITQRKLNGLLGGLWEFPGGKLGENEESAVACVREIREETGIQVEIDRFLTRVKHGYTHFKIEMDVFYCHYVSGEVALKGPIDYKWITVSDMDAYPFPRANKKFIPLIQTQTAGV